MFRFVVGIDLYTCMKVVEDKAHKVRKYRAVVCTAIGGKLKDLVEGKDYRFAKKEVTGKNRAAR